MNTKHTVFAVRLRPYDGCAVDSGICSEGLLNGYGLHGAYYVQTVNSEKTILLEDMKPLHMKAYYSKVAPPKISKLKSTQKDRTQNELWWKSLTEVIVEPQTALWLVKKIGFKNLYKESLLEDVDLVNYPMIEIGHTYLPLLEIKKGVLQFSKEETKFQKDLSKQLGMLSTYLRILDEQSMDIISELNSSQRSNLFSYVQNINKFLDKNIK